MLRLTNDPFLTDAGSHLRYRPDIDGLRAIAVLVVLLFHAKIPGFSGGYVGVDVFFVISGFLITSIIHREIDQNQFSITRFYERRVRRIMPAMLVVILVSAIISIMIFLPADLIAFAKSGLATLGFVSNVYFWRTTTYFDSPAEYKPLLHTWSLGIEEQYYIFFPLMLMLIMKFWRKQLLPITLMMWLTSFGLCLFAVSANKMTPAFYLIPFRAWELFVGSLLALGFQPSFKRPAMRTVCAGMGLTLVLAATFLYTSSTVFPGAAALLPCIGTALVIAAGRDGDHHISSVLGSKYLVSIGLISYSLYLVHWPVLVFAKYYLVRELSVVEALGALALSAVLAALSFRYVERPFRDRKMRVGRVCGITGALAAIAAVVSIGTMVYRGFPSRFSPAVGSINAAVGTIYKCDVSKYLLFGGYYACPLNLRSRDVNKAEVVLWGDSHAQMYAAAVERALQSAGQSGILVPLTGCPPTIARNISQDCARLNAANMIAIGKLPNLHTVILGLRWEGYANSTFYDADGISDNGPPYSLLFRELTETVDRLTREGKRVVIVGPIATPEYDLPSIVSRSIAFNRPLGHPIWLPRRKVEAELAPVVQYLKEMDRHPGVSVIDMQNEQCDASRCYFMKGDKPLFADTNHLSTDYSATLDRVFLPELAKALPGR